MNTVVSMEAARPTPPTELRAQFVRTFVEPATERHRAGDKAAAVDIFLSGVFGSGYRPALDDGLPGAFERAVAEADAFFAQELPAVQQWSFTEDDALRPSQPGRARMREREQRAAAPAVAVGQSPLRRPRGEIPTRR